eukprot:TRINITY_DN9609_c0_g1_i1.p1 TRINITY_DN9609_c0_g1~~TRINITY_DN9609_c0_g1_i1.p1  ORF type:complete len:223 (+),score=24.98 TRINITY_DN9609_c0_g1_i1:349-1017(+)
MIVLGLSGATCSGKTSICNILQRIFTNAKVFNQDAYYWKEDSPNHVKDEKTGFINWELASSFNMAALNADLQAAIAAAPKCSKVPDLKHSWTKENVFNQSGELALGNEINPETLENFPLIIVEGILVLNDERIAQACDFKFFVDLDKETCWQRRQHRTYDPEDQIGYFENLAWPYFKSNLDELKQSPSAADIRWLSGKDSIESNVCNVLNHLALHQYSKPTS